MKLYTEIEVKKMIEDMGSFSNGGIDYRINQMKPIELPSDEEIEKVANELIYCESEAEFYNGAKWVIEQIKEQVPTRSLADDVQSVVSENNKTDKITDVVKLVKDMRDVGLLSTPAYTLPMVDTIGKTKQKD